MTDARNQISLSRSALVAGIALLISAIAAPYAELYVLPKLILPYKAAETAQNVMAHEGLFTSAIFAYFIAFTCDIVIAWALYILLKPLNSSLSLLTAWFRFVYAVIALVALNNLITALGLLTTKGYLNIFEPDQLYAQAMICLRAFRNHWYFGLLFFGIHLVMLGTLVFRSKYIPRIFGILLIIAGSGYLLTSLRPYLFPAIKIDFARYTFFGELAFMLWLIVRGKRIKEIN